MLNATLEIEAGMAKLFVTPSQTGMEYIQISLAYRVCQLSAVSCLVHGGELHMIHCSINDCSTRAFTLVVGCQCPWRWFRDFLRNAEFWSNARNSAKFRGIVTVKFSGIQYIFAHGIPYVLYGLF
jgi:hypothetical protein